MENEFNYNRRSEVSKPVQEFARVGQNAAAQENSLSPENVAAQERTTATSKPKSTQDKKKTEILAKLLATTVVVTSGTVGVVAATPKVDVRFEALEASANGVQYSVFVEDLDQPLVLALQNDFTNREVVLREGINEGEFTGLVSNMQYVLTVYYAEGLKRELAQEKIQTLKYKEEVVQAGFERLDYESAESAQGSFTFTPYYSDPNGTWTEMWVTLTDEYGVGAADAVIEESGVACEIPLTDRGFFGSNGNLQVWAFSTEKQENELLYEQAVSITQTQTQLLSVNFTPAGADATARCSVEYIDENGYWQFAEDGEILEAEISAVEEGYDGGQINYIYRSGDEVSFMIYRAYYGKVARLLLQIYAYNADGEKVCLYAQEDDGIGEDFIPSTSDWYVEPTE